jgi:hypothetical protein
MYNNYYSSPVLANCTFWGNSAERWGGGMFNHSSSPALTNCTFWGNSAGGGGGVYNDYDSSPALTNSILWSDTPDEIYNYNLSGIPIIAFSDIQGGYVGEGNIDADPLFLEPDNGDFHLGPGSPCIDAGTNPGAPATDYEGDPRPIDGDGDGTATVDMGVDESPFLVELDIKPGSRSNTINLGSRSALPVAILTTVEFDATDVDPGTVSFASAAPVRWRIDYVDRDGDLDLLLYFKIQELDLNAGSTEATLFGETFDGIPIQGTDTLKIIP